MVRPLKEALRRIRRWTAPVRRPWRELRNSIARKTRVAEFRYGSTLIRAKVRPGTMDEGIFGTVYEEYGIASLVRSLTGRRAKVLDIGGHIGGFSVTLASLLPDAESHVYEFVPENYRLLQTNVSLNGLKERVRVCHRAVGDRSGRFVPAIRFTPADVNTGRTCIAGAAHVSAKAGKTAVPTIASQEILAGFDRVDVLKIDCEGSEYKILFSLDERDYQKIGLITGELHDTSDFSGLETSGHPWTSDELLDYLRRFYRRVTVQPTKPGDWCSLRLFTAEDPIATGRAATR